MASGNRGSGFATWISCPFFQAGWDSGAEDEGHAGQGVKSGGMTPAGEGSEASRLI